MKTIEQFKAEQDKALKVHQAKMQIAEKFSAAGLPIPSYIGGALYGAIGVTYWNKNEGLRSMADAIALAKSFPSIVPFQVLRNGCTLITPESILPAKDKKGYVRDSGRQASDYAFMLKIGHIEDSTRVTTASLEFWTRIEGTVFNVTIDFGTDYIGGCHALRPVTKIVRGFANRIVSASFEPNTAVYGMADSFLSYASGDMGPIKKSADHRFLFVSDQGEQECTIAECAHALAQLTNIADNTGA